MAALVTVKPADPDSTLFHTPNVDWTVLQAKAMDIPHVAVVVGKQELDVLEKALIGVRERFGIVGLATGALASDYQKSRFDRVCDGSGLKSYAPLWHKNPRIIVDDLQSAGFRIIMSAVGALGLDGSWLGKELGEAEWSELEKLSSRHGIHLSGEGGEYETFVVDAPHFGSEVVVGRSRPLWNGQSGRLVIEEASLRKKPSN